MCIRDRIILIPAVLLSFCSFSQSQWGPSQQNSSIRQDIPGFKSISWKKIVDQEILGLGKQSLLYFENAQYDLGNHLFPIYVERIKLPSGSTGASTELINAIYQPLNESEKLTIKNNAKAKKGDFTPDQVIPAVTVSYIKKNPYAYVQFVPIRKNKATGEYEKLVSFSLQVKRNDNANKLIQSTKTLAVNSVLATGKWHKVSVAADGMYKMDFAFLKALGIEVDSINPKNIRIYGNGGGQLPFANAKFRHDDLKENAISVVGENDGRFDSTDYVLFYGQSQHRWKYKQADKKFHHAFNIYSDTTYYFITTDLGLGKRVAAQNSSAIPPTHTVSSFDDYQFHELEGVNLLKTGRVWLGETFDIITSYSFTFNFPNIESISPAYARVEVAARADAPGTNFSWSAGNASSTFNVTQVNTTDIYGTYYRIVADTASFYPSSGAITVTVTKTTPTPSIGWLNHIEVNARRLLTMNGGQMVFRDVNSADTGNVSQFVISNASALLQVWNVTEPTNCFLQQGTFSGNTFDFTLTTDSLREFAAFNGQSFFTPKKAGEVANQNLHGLAQSDFINSYPSFVSATVERFG